MFSGRAVIAGATGGPDVISALFAIDVIDRIGCPANGVCDGCDSQGSPKRPDRVGPLDEVGSGVLGRMEGFDVDLIPPWLDGSDRLEDLGRVGSCDSQSLGGRPVCLTV